jgi:REP element-mobilizing transposase RayT
MTAPRQILPGRIYLVTRRCSERRFFLKPSRAASGIFLYVLALAARRHGVQVHAFCVLSNHYHLLLTDPEARLPAFVQYLDSLVARATNAFLGRFEGFWAAAASYSAVAHEDPEDVVAKAAYVLANPVAAGLVRRASEWPGLWTSPRQIGAATLVAHRPKVFFCSGGYLPESVTLTLVPPPGFASADEFQARVAVALRELEEQSAREVESDGRRFVGVAKVLAQSPFARPAPREPRFRINPRLAARDKWKRIEAIGRLKEFLSDYREAWHARRAGADALFPAGTYLLQIMHGVRCADCA